jgi:hypothetical protein
MLPRTHVLFSFSVYQSIKIYCKFLSIVKIILYICGKTSTSHMRPGNSIKNHVDRKNIHLSRQFSLHLRYNFHSRVKNTCVLHAILHWVFHETAPTFSNKHVSIQTRLCRRLYCRSKETNYVYRTLYLQPCVTT